MVHTKHTGLKSHTEGARLGSGPRSALAMVTVESNLLYVVYRCVCVCVRLVDNELRRKDGFLPWAKPSENLSSKP